MMINCFRSARFPSISFDIPRSRSVVRALYDVTTVKDDDTLHMQVTREPNEWLLTISGEMLNCPGLLWLKDNNNET